jgi:hypothetical protein
MNNDRIALECPDSSFPAETGIRCLSRGLRIMLIALMADWPVAVMP